MALDKNQIAIITEDVRRASIALDDLRDELIDHLCCEVEVLMDNGLSFEEAYARTKQIATLNELQSIEENTILLIDKNYSRMKTLMRISGNVSLILLAIGTIMKIFEASGWAIVLTLAFAILCLEFLPLALYTYRADTFNRKNWELKISVFLVGLLFPLGILFRTMQWSGANILLVSAFSILLFAVLPLTWIIIKSRINDKKARRIYLFGIFSLAIFIAAVAFKMFYLPAASLLMTIGSILLVSVFLPLYSFREFRKTNNISAQFIYVIIVSVYVVTMVMLMSFGAQSDLHNLTSIK